MHLFSLVSGLLLVFAVRAWAKPQQSADTLLWNGQQDFSNVPSNLIPAELTSQGAVLPADSNVMLVRRPNGARRKPIRLRQQQVAELNRQIKLGNHLVLLNSMLIIKSYLLRGKRNNEQGANKLNRRWGI